MMENPMNLNVSPTGSNFTNVNGVAVQVNLNDPDECKKFLGAFNWNKNGGRMAINKYNSNHAISVLNF